MSCSLMMKKDGRRRSRPEQPGILFFVLCGEDGEHRREGLHLGARQPQRGVDGARNLERERGEDALRLASADMQAFTPMLAILSARHEEQYSRLFRS